MKRNELRKTNRMSDGRIIKRCLQGYQDEFERIVEKYKGKAMALALNVLGNREDAEDVCQEAFAKVFLSLKSYNPQRDFKNWLYSILYHSCIDCIRRKRRFFNFLSIRQKELSPIHEDEAKKSMQESVLPEAYLQELRPRERTALVLWATESYTSREIASVLNCSASTARVHLYKARKKVRSFLEEKKA